MNKTVTSRDIVLVVIGAVSTLITGILLAVIVGEGRFAALQLTLLQLVLLVVSVLGLLALFVFLALRWRATLGPLRALSESVAVTTRWVVHNALYVLSGIVFGLLAVGVYVVSQSWIVVGLFIAYTIFFGLALSALLHRPRYVRIDIGPILQWTDLTRIYRQLPQGYVHFCEVPFVLQSKAFHSENLSREAIPAMTERRLDEPLLGVRAVHVLINAANGWRTAPPGASGANGINLVGTTIGRIRFVFRDKNGNEQSQETVIALGRNVREWAYPREPYHLVGWVTSLRSREAWRGQSNTGHEAVVDKLAIPVKRRHRKQELVNIVLIRDVRPGTPQGSLAYFIPAITAECE